MSDFVQSYVAVARAVEYNCSNSDIQAQLCQMKIIARVSRHGENNKIELRKTTLVVGEYKFNELINLNLF
jgi:hypothetical protein